VEVILLKKVGHLGGLGDKVSVRSGYGRNYLIPSGLAVPATDANLNAFEERRAELEREAGEALTAAEARRTKLDGLTVTVARKAGDEGRLFGSVGTGDIADAVRAMGQQLEKQEVRLPQGPFRAAGEYEVVVHLHTDVDATLKLEIIPEG
jgi:large subunit ribosomal protein L9